MIHLHTEHLLGHAARRAWLSSIKLHLVHSLGILPDHPLEFCLFSLRAYRMPTEDPLPSRASMGRVQKQAFFVGTSGPYDKEGLLAYWSSNSAALDGLWDFDAIELADARNMHFSKLSKLCTVFFKKCMIAFYCYYCCIGYSCCFWTCVRIALIGL